MRVRMAACSAGSRWVMASRRICQVSSGVLFLNNRYHDPSLGMFVSADPLATDTVDPYSYATNNPTTYSDPTGLCVQEVFDFCLDAVASGGGAMHLGTSRYAGGGRLVPGRDDLSVDALSGMVEQQVEPPRVSCVLGGVRPIICLAPSGLEPDCGPTACSATRVGSQARSPGCGPRSAQSNHEVIAPGGRPSYGAGSYPLMSMVRSVVAWL